MVAGLLALSCAWLVELEIPVSRAIAVGAIFLVIGFTMFTTYAGTQINTTDPSFRQYRALVGIKRGEWEPLHAVSSIQLLTTEQSFQTLPDGIHPSLSGKVKEYIVLVLGDHDQEVILQLNYQRKSRAKKVAQQLAEQLNVALVEG